MRLAIGGGGGLLVVRKQLLHGCDFIFIYLLVNCPLRMTGKSKVVFTHNHKYYHIRPNARQNRYHGIGYNNTQIYLLLVCWFVGLHFLVLM
jgi:hypothetical protein